MNTQLHVDFEVTVEDGVLNGSRAGAGRPLVLLHGWTLDRRMWARQIEAFAPDHLVIAIDRRGFGRSTAPPDLSREADDLARVLDSIGVERALVLGMSQAGRVALDFALRFADRTSALALQGAPFAGVTPGPDDAEAIPIIEYSRLARAGQLDKMKQRWRQHPLMRVGNAEAAACVDAMLADYQGRDLLQATSFVDLEQSDIARITVPALVVTGAEDTPWRQRAADVLARTLPKATRLSIADAGHMCNLCGAEIFNTALRQLSNDVQV